SLSSAYAHSDAAENVRATRAACEKELETLSMLEKAGANLQAKDQIAKISAYLHNYNEKSQALTRTAEAILDEYESTLSNAKIAMELNYKISKVELMRDNIASVLQLENVVPMRDIQNRVKLATAALRELKDIKALVAEKVEDSSTTATMFKDVTALFASDPIFQGYLSSLITNPKTRYNPCNVRLELIRPVKAQVSALDAGYTNLSCSATFKLLNKAVAEIHSLHDHWFGSFSRISGDRSRMREAHREIANVLYSGDQSKFPNLALTRFERIETALFLVLEVFCPVIMLEVQSFTNTLDQLGAHQHLDERASAQEEFQVKRSEVGTYLDDDTRYLR
ncbi:MAG: hypothetical protein K2H85_01360, partial [Allobaculum sp.]|nr:hypothetical protein [Allobaculum sp.]